MDRRSFITLLGAGASVLVLPDLNGATSMYGLIGRMRAIPGQRAALAAILLEGTAAMPGCLSYVIAEDPADDVEPENSNGSPVQTSDNQDGKSDFIQKKFPLSDVAFPEREEI